MSQDQIQCPFCGLVGPAIYAYDGGSSLCQSCGYYHRCMTDGQARRGPGPLDCQICKAGRAAMASRTTPAVASAPIVHFCDSCQISLSDKYFQAHWRCTQCPDFDLCNRCIGIAQHHNLHIFHQFNAPKPGSRLVLE